MVSADEQDQAQIVQEPAREEPVRQVSESVAPMAPPQQLNKVQYHTSDTEQLPARQGQTLNQRIMRNSRTMSEHKSSQNQNSHANMTNHQQPASLTQ